jgi:hypothetical protein
MRFLPTWRGWVFGSAAVYDHIDSLSFPCIKSRPNYLIPPTTFRPIKNCIRAVSLGLPGTFILFWQGSGFYTAFIGESCRISCNLEKHPSFFLKIDRRCRISRIMQHKSTVSHLAASNKGCSRSRLFCDRGPEWLTHLRDM